jgi:CheY-like chemotaxis protein
MLQDLGYTARDAADGQAALAILRESTRIDLLVSDIGLPGGLNGRDVADKARLLRPDMKVLFITGYAETTILAQGKLKTGMRIMSKPFTMEELGHQVRAMLAQTASVAG